MYLNKAIDQARQDLGLSWAELWARVGVSENTGLNIRYARTHPRAEHVAALEDALGWDRGTYWTLRNGTTEQAPATPQERLTRAIEASMADLKLNATQLGTRAGFTRHTLANLKKGAGSDRTIERLEKALDWDPGTYRAIWDGTKDGPATTPTPAIDEQLRMVGTSDTEHGTLTWVGHPNGTRDYTLTRDGVPHGVTITKSSLSPQLAAEDLRVALDLMATLHQHQPGAT